MADPPTKKKAEFEIWRDVLKNNLKQKETA